MTPMATTRAELTCAGLGRTSRRASAPGPALHCKLACALALSVLLSGCEPSDPNPPEVGSNSNWLTACAAPVDCGAPNIPECACGVCTVICARDEDCSAITDATCALGSSSAARSSCERMSLPDVPANMTVGLCLPRCEPGGCDPTQACVSGACMLADLPDTDLCNTLPPADELTRALEDELLALAQARRTAGDLMCAGEPSSMPQPELRFSPALRCAARALALDMEQTRSTSLTDSLGRDTPTRLQLAGYRQTLWAEAFAIEAADAQRALELMITDSFPCSRLASPDFIDVGLGVSGDVYVMTLGAR